MEIVKRLIGAAIMFCGFIRLRIEGRLHDRKVKALNNGKISEEAYTKWLNRRTI